MVETTSSSIGFLITYIAIFGFWFVCLIATIILLIKHEKERKNERHGK